MTIETISAIARITRNIAWQRAKAKLQTMLCTCFLDDKRLHEGQAEDLDRAIENFIEHIELNCLNE